MDRSLQQQLYGSMPRNSMGGRSTASSVSNASGRRATLGGAGGNYKKQSNMTVGGQSRYSVSGRTNHTLPGIRCSDFNTVENYGYQLPVLVSEALTFNEKNLNTSVMCSENGWTWVVHGRRLLVWQYKDTRNWSTGSSPPRTNRTPQRRAGVVAQCRELTLPHCDIGHKASLVCVFVSEGQQMASCIAVTPTGDARYWPSIAHDGSSVDTTGILDGQEFDKLLYIPKQNGYVAVTTTCNLIFLQLQLVNGRHVIHYKTIKQPSGFLGGFGKKFASIIIGMNSGGDKENKFIALACEKTNDQEAIIAVLADRWIQRWRLSPNCSSEQLICEDTEILRKILEEFQQKIWNIRADNINVNIVMHLLDMHYNDGKIYILAGAVNPSHTPQMYYGIATITVGETLKLQQFSPLKLALFYNANSEQECLSIRFIVSHTHLYLYTDKVIYPLHLGNLKVNEMEAEKIEFQIQDDRILNAAMCLQMPLFFSRTHGMICITPSDFDSADYMNMSSTSPDVFSSPMHSDSTLREHSMLSGSGERTSLHIYDLDPDAMYEEFKDEVSQLKAAFVYRLKRNNNMCQEIIANLLRTTSETQTGSNLADANQLDKIVITIAEDLAEDIPAADPRWEQMWEESNGNKHALGSSSSLQILTQLKEKNMALRQFVEFLHATGIWDKLNAVPNGGGTLLKPTCYVLSDINEKIVAASALRTKQNKSSKLVDEAIITVVSQWQESPHDNLTAQDIFYVRLCKFQEIFHVFGELADQRIESNQSTQTIANTLKEINDIVLYMLNEVFTYRAENSSLFTLCADKLNIYEYLPWTAMSGNNGLRDALTHLIDLTVRHGARCTHEVELKQKLYQQILELIDFLLDGRRSYLDSINDTEKFNVLEQQFESQRRDLISILIDDGQYELAAKLAEKYLDFQSLVVICDETKNQERLDAYIKKFEDFNFSQIAINWHLRQNRQGEVFERFKDNQAALSQFMRDHPTLGWIQLVFNGDFERAAKILYQLAQNETEFVQRKKSMLSLAKLAAFSAADSGLFSQVEHINTELNIIKYQEQLSLNLLQAYGYDVINQRVLKVEEIINLFISEENETGNEFDFRKAIELLHYVEEPYDARHKIWCAAILRNNWTDYDVNDAMSYMQNLLFFKLIDVCHLIDGDVDRFLPPMEDFLNSSELENLNNNQSFKYLLKLVYEHIYNTFRKSDMGNEMQMDTHPIAV